MAEGSRSTAGPSDLPSMSAPASDTFDPSLTWGPLSSVIWVILVGLLVLMAQVMVLVGGVIGQRLIHQPIDLAGLGENGLILATTRLVGLPIVVGAIPNLIRVRGWRPGAYLALRPASWRATILAVTGLILWLAVAGGLMVRYDRPVRPPFPFEAIFATPLWLLALAVAVAVPIAEEVVFRGFLYRGLAESRLGPGWAIGLTATAWSALHLQGNLFAVSLVYLTGLYLGAVRHYSGSLYLTILLHSLFNIATTAGIVQLAGSIEP